MPHTNVPAELTQIAFSSALPESLDLTVEKLREKHLPLVREELADEK